MLNFHCNAAPNPMQVALIPAAPGLPHGAENDEAKRFLFPSSERLTK